MRLLAALLLAGFLPLLPGPGSRTASGEALTVVDAAGVPVGPVVAVSGGIATVLLEKGGQLASARVARDRFVVSEIDFVLFVASDCTGPPLLFDFLSLLVPGAPSIATLSGIGPGNVLLVGTGVSPAKIVVQSAYVAGHTPPCVPIGGNVPVVPGTAFLDLSQFVGPFEVR